ncbi:MAG: DUF460 domain-containing protein [Nanohaloarchaea archaeon]|nr:DUF460 domain-containing protein [Candidatus Nanohaloarchaea archaeon]
MSKRPLIVGIDPGNTSAVAALDLEGELVFLESRLEFSRSEIIQKIIEVGHPVVVSCDKADMPSNVEKIASSLGANRFEPEEDLPKQRKEELGRGDNSHEKDAHASALHAYKSLRKQFRKINKRSRENDLRKWDVAKDYFSQRGDV